MNIFKSKQPALLVCAALLVLFSVSSLMFVNPVLAAPEIDVTVDSGRIISVNELSLGFMVGYDWRTLRDRSAQRQLAEDADFKMIRFFGHLLEPCSYWNEAARTGTFNWANVDSFVQRIFEIGAEPSISLGHVDASTKKPVVPRGMAINPTTGLPYPNSWAAYCRQWVRHFKQTGKPVRFYEIINEPWLYFGWNNYGKIANYMAVFNAAATAMRNENSNVLLGFDASTRKPVLNFWLDPNFKYRHTVGANLGFLSFHKYDSGTIGQRSDANMLSRAETFKLKTDSGGSEDGYYGIEDAQSLYYQKRGKVIPVINSESNFNSAWETGSDPRIQKMIGAVWLALVLRTGILEGLSYNSYFSFSTSASQQMRNPSGGLGFGMINTDDNQPWYPYYVHKMIGPNLDVADRIVRTTSSSSEIRPLAWIHRDKLNLLIICKVDQTRSVRLHGLQGQLNYFKIDNTVWWKTPRIQTGTISATTTISLSGYTVMLLQTDISAPPPPPPPPTPGSAIFEDGFESGSFNQWTGTSTTSGETATVVSSLPYQGSYSARFTSNGNGGLEKAYSYKTISSVSELYARGYFRVSQSGIRDNDDRFYFMRFRAGNNNIAYAGWRRTGGSVRWNLIIRDGTGWASTYSGSSPSLNQWYSVELHWIASSTNGRGELYVNGGLVCSIQGRNTAALGNVNQVWLGLTELYNSGSTTVYGDCFQTSTTYIGPELPEIFEDGFESGSFNQWTGTSTTSGETATVVSSLPYQGSYSARFTSNGNGGLEKAYSYKTISSVSELYARGYFRVSQSGIRDNDDRFYFMRFRAGNNGVAYAGWRRTGGVVRWSLIIRDGTGWVTAYSNWSPSLNRWYSVELHWVQSRTNGRGELWVDGNLVTSIQGRNTATFGSVNQVRLGLAELYNSGSTIVYSDDCVLSETYIGPEP